MIQAYHKNDDFEKEIQFLYSFWESNKSIMSICRFETNCEAMLKIINSLIKESSLPVIWSKIGATPIESAIYFCSMHLEKIKSALNSVLNAEHFENRDIAIENALISIPNHLVSISAFFSEARDLYQRAETALHEYESFVYNKTLS